MSKLREQVLEFHRAYGQPIGERPDTLSNDRLRLRLRLVTEECMELLDAAGCFDHEINKAKQWIRDAIGTADYDSTDLAEVADALADLDYVIEGTRIEFGIDGDPIADEVHRSNMSKLGDDGEPILREDGKVLKNPKYSPADIAGELRKQGWTG